MAAVLLGGAQTSPAVPQAATRAKSSGNMECRVESVDSKGWQAQQVSNRWVQLITVPQNGGRLMQVRFNGHAYLFVNPKLAESTCHHHKTSGSTTEGTSFGCCPGEKDEQH